MGTKATSPDLITAVRVALGIEERACSTCRWIIMDVCHEPAYEEGRRQDSSCSGYGHLYWEPCPSPPKSE